MIELLIIDDDLGFCDLLTQYFKVEQVNADACNTGERGLIQASHKYYDAILLDIMLPDINGIELLKQLRQKHNTPIIMLTARGEDMDKIVGLENGADDYVSKPCNPRELLARVRAVLRRSQKLQQGTNSTLTFGNLILDLTKRSLTLDGRSVELTNAEFNILEMLLSAPNHVFSKRTLTEEALNRDFTAYDRSVDTHISNLRSKLASYDFSGGSIKTSHGFGYLFETND